VKYYPPFQISRISEQDDKTIVEVKFYSISRAKFNANRVIRDRGNGKEPHAMNANVGGILDRTEIFTFSKMTADEARLKWYENIEKTGKYEIVE